AVNDTATIKELEAIGTPDPQNTHQYFTFSRNFRSLWAKPDQDWLAHLRAQVKTDLSVVAAHIGTDVFIIQGADDVISPLAGAQDYFAKIVAPHKEFIALPNAGHFAFMTSDAFLPALTDKVRPVAIARGA